MGEDEGYAVVDMLMALMIFASTLTFAMAAMHQSVRVARAAAEVRAANLLFASILETHRANLTADQGQTRSFQWRFDVDPPSQISGASALCHRRVEIISLSSERRYEMEADEICPVDDLT